MSCQVALVAELVGVGGADGGELWSWEPALDAPAVLQRLVREQRDAVAAIKKITVARLAALRRHSP